MSDHLRSYGYIYYNQLTNPETEDTWQRDEWI